MALASTVMSARPAFVFLYAMVLSRYFPGVASEPLTRNVILTKSAAIILVMGGVALLTF